MAWKHKILSPEQEEKLESDIAEFEQKTGAELIICILKSADPYPAAVLRFGLLATILSSMVIATFFQFHHPLFLVVAQCALFILFTLLGRLPFFKSLCFSKTELKREVDEKSTELFHRLNMSDTSKRVGVLLVISLQEKLLKLVVDKKLKEKITFSDLKNIIVSLERELSHKRYDQGIRAAVQDLQGKVLHFFPEGLRSPGDSTNELPNKVIWLNYFN